jgi:hypothetical protein
LQNKLLIREELSRARGSIPRHSLVGVYKTYITNICRASIVPTTSAIGYILYVLRLLARVLVSSEPVIVELEALIDILL